MDPAGIAGIGVSVIGGYLGSGKTTLVNHLLQHCGQERLAVLVNDFGAIAIDASLILSRSATVISISGGCVCCSYGGDLIGALQSLAASADPPQTILIETSGVALPRAVLQSASLVPGLRARGVTVVAAAETLLARAADRFLADTMTRQIRDADIVLLNKVDLASADEAQRAEEWVRAVNPQAEVVRTERSRIGLASILAGHRRNDKDGASRAVTWPVPASHRYCSEEFTPTHAVDVHWLARELAKPERRLLRSKGVLKGRDGTLQVLQVVGERFEVRAADPIAGREHILLGLVCIGMSGDVDRAALARLIEAARTAAGC